jgi:hypothetical protein
LENKKSDRRVILRWIYGKNKEERYMELGSGSCDMLGSSAGISSFDIIFILSQSQYTVICLRFKHYEQLPF